MQTEIIKQERQQINILITELTNKLIILNSKKESINKNTPFSDSLNKHFYGGKVGYLSKRDNNRKAKELDNLINACNTKKEIESKIKTIENNLKHLKTGKYILRKNGLLVKSYECLTELLTAIENILNTGIIKGEKLNTEQEKSIKELRTEYKKEIKQREKLILKTL